LHKTHGSGRCETVETSGAVGIPFPRPLLAGLVNPLSLALGQYKLDWAFQKGAGLKVSGVQSLDAPAQARSRYAVRSVAVGRFTAAWKTSSSEQQDGSIIF
jgi:hypothetical protein